MPPPVLLLTACRLAQLRGAAAAAAAMGRAAAPAPAAAAAARIGRHMSTRAASSSSSVAFSSPADDARELAEWGGRQPRGLADRSDVRLAAPGPPPVVHSPLYSAPQLPPGHRFPMAVFGRIHHQLLKEGTVAHPGQVHRPAAPPSRELLHLVHTPEYVAAFLSGGLDEQRLRRIGFGEAASTQVLIDRTLSEVAGTILTAELALEHGLACSTAGGTHHAFPDYGSGFCILNDLAVAAELLLRQGRAQRVLIADLDVHQGDGTAAIFQGRRDVFTLSVHAAANFPARKQTSHLDVALPDGTGDADFLRAVAEALTGALQSFRPDLVLYDAGVDVHADDSLGRLAVSDDGLRRRELLVLDSCLGLGVPVAGYVGGGYAPDLPVLAARHCWLHRAAAQMWQDHGL